MSKNLVKSLQKIDKRVKSVKDAKRPLSLHVSSVDVKGSQSKSHNHCALAVACMRAKKPLGVIASRSRLYVINKQGVALRYYTPPNARRELTSFDRGASFAPGVYTMTPPNEADQLGKKHKRPSGPRKTKVPTRRKLIDDIRVAL